MGGGHLKFQTTEAEAGHRHSLTATSAPQQDHSSKVQKLNKALIFLVRKRMFLFYHVHNVLFISKIGTVKKAMGHRGPEMGRTRE